MLEKFRRKYIGDRNFYKSYIALALPMIIQNAVTNLVSFLDNIMVGQLGTEQMSGVAIVNQLIFVYNLAIFGAVSAASIFGAQYFGKGNHKGHMYSFRFKLYAALTVTALTILLFVTKGESLISLYLTDTSGSGATGAALQYGLEYLIIMMAGLIPFAVNQSYATNIKETGQTLIPMIASFVAVGSNAILDYLLIFGIGPFPELGVQGAALATVIARYIEALMIIIWAHRHSEKNRYLKGAYTGFGIPTDELKAIIIKGLPLMMNEVLWAAGMTAVIQCYSIRGLEVVAGLNIATTITNLFNIIYIQLGACISIVVGQYLGAGKLEKAKDADNKMIVFSVFCCIIVAICMLFIGRFFPQIYNTSEEIRALATKFIAVSAIIMPFCSFSHASYFTLRSGGKTMVTFLFDSVFTWIIIVPTAFLLAHFTGLGIVSVYFLVQATELIKVVIGYFMVRSNVWLVQMV
ncbi:MATE family efflux transporter [Anaerosacchariphilus sp. NSJ-68]|uniref:Probable multidrug resistance protein NorM n=2 Tax=Lachnospiraceae TaxID=186803 RepID=A0A923LBL8_9FIRM|nr:MULTISPECIES: MATE family efflux transporter [Lachnospiraceae]MBC5659371.1 MATE family efflux transporter [Anaerosacchariphilus hominis]MBC5697037.1 MATE family efflux transporter [Roseburia difficilis]